jgi:hypothetical protein
VKWKIPAWAAGVGALVSVVAGIAAGRGFGALLLRALVSVLLAGAFGWAAQYVLRRFLPGAAEPRQGSVDILVDEELPLAAGDPASRPSDSSGVAPGFALEEEPAFALNDSAGSRLDNRPDSSPGVAPGFTPGSRPDSSPGVAPGFTPAENEAFLDLPETEGFAGPASEVPEFDAGEEVLEAEELPSGEALEALPAAGELPNLEEEEQGLPSRRGLKAEELEAQLDNVTQGQDPASLAKAVRTFLRKDQEG